MAMLAARGVSLGLGKINLADLNQKPADKHRYLAQVRSEKKKKPRIIIKKKADPKTIWAACRAVIFGCIIIAVGLAMAILGYFDKQFSERVEIIDGNEISYQDKLIQYQLKSMQYLGPILMGVGCVLLIIACVITLESRDKHTQIITEEVPNRKNTQEPNAVDDNDRKISELESGTNIESPRKRSTKHVFRFKQG
ncbi:hypothetical protein WR25_07712 [Diploscapter pachys]|uniref:Uncharacterized protein n=1 Tax=Diploscapter pachys TaxID=2018661 RepID=A0A2A2L1I3_9BILA|nr:hypothetical protein WR25_07712 [Diploscapter pachys]